MGGPGSGRRPRAVERAAAVAGMSRVQLEPWLAKAARLGDQPTVDAIVAELAARVWQGFNPYAALDTVPAVAGDSARVPTP
jgi:hypothetical protein